MAANNSKDKGYVNKNSTNAKANNNKNRGKIDNSYTEKRKEAARKAIEEDPDSRMSEIYLFIYLAISIFLLCSNFGWCGVIGDFISRIIFGLFGTVSYIIPIYLFFSVAFLLSNGAHKKIVKRVICVALFIIALAFVCQLVSGATGIGIKELYKDGSIYKRGGGVLLGGILVLLYKLIGLTGSIIVICLLSVIGTIVVLDISLVDLFKAKVKNKRKDDLEYQEQNYAYRENPNKNKDMLNSIKVLDTAEEAIETKPRTKNKKENKIVANEEVHELKPVKNEEILLGTNQNATPIDFFQISSDRNRMSGNTYRQENVVHDSFEQQMPQFNNEAVVPNSFIPSNDISEIKTEEIYADNMPEKLDSLMPEQSEKVENVSEKKSVKSKVEKSDITADDIAKEITNKEQKKKYKLPTVDLLKPSSNKGKSNNDMEVRNTAIKLKNTLENFGVNVSVTDYSCGPSVTRFELQPEQGVKVSKILGLADDIKLNLAAADIRIEAPIPGKAAIGIEVPNKESSSVSFRELLESSEFKNFKSNIAFAVGKDIAGKVIVADIAKMPHLLVAGATGSGKSVCINTLIMSILYKANPDDVKLIMVDPKQVELSVYNGIPHMLIPVVTDPKKAAGALNWAVMEMTNRYNLFAQYNVRNLQGYNDKVYQVTGNVQGNEELKKLPQIVIIVDELADLMMVAHGEVEEAIVRLSQLARAAGIHLIIATQRPSVDVITGLIKANVPSRIAMSVSSGVDSRTILDQTGAEKLLGKGDMLFYPTGYPKPVRVQGAYLTDDEIVNVVDYIKNQFDDEATYDESIAAEISNVSSSSGTASSGVSDLDDNFVPAGRFIIEKDKASIGMLQRVYKIGFNRAARIMDQLADAGVVGPEEGNKPRKVLMTMEEFENYVEENL